MSESASDKPIEPDPSSAAECVTENLGSIYIFEDVKLIPVRQPPHPAVQEWIRQHQYLLQPPKKEDKEAKEDKEGKDEKK